MQRRPANQTDDTKWPKKNAKGFLDVPSSDKLLTMVSKCPRMVKGPRVATILELRPDALIFSSQDGSTRHHKA